MASSSVVPAFVLGLLLVAPHAYADVDLTGRWRVSDAQYADIVQVGSDVTVSYTESLGGGTPVFLVGTFDQATVSASDGTFDLVLKMVGPGNVLDGSILPELGRAHRRFTRCECYDGNSNDGDGCDSECLVEPCFTCTPEPSVCSPSADGAPCDDRDDCTSGEQCSAGSCGDGSAVSPCVNMAGSWRVYVEATWSFDGSVTRSAADAEFRQRDGVLTSSLDGIGTIFPGKPPTSSVPATVTFP